MSFRLKLRENTALWMDCNPYATTTNYLENAPVIIMLTEISGLNYQGSEVWINGEIQGIAKPMKFQKVSMEAFCNARFLAHSILLKQNMGH